MEQQKPLSFWGGFDPVSGKVINRSHSFYGNKRCIKWKNCRV
ncbi:DUF126 domain-containing protein [Bacillus sp. ISL-40]|nr:DUF126 domain-containing protein [Bacillus sp. ISL-40]MBT2719698.1 DUF126 domain-containing protein [Bacillus sp. ISL-46]MBT2742139.1 DUF126 domain-containing protein [Bacillus sp. ISL-77]